MDDNPRLTQLAQACGCAAKLAPQILAAVLPRLPADSSPDLLTSFAGCEDAAVFRLTPELALVQTVDFFTPIVDNPEDYGAIAAANALSDVYAMGGEPKTALAIVGFPAQADPDLLVRILTGGSAVLREAGCILAGGHSLRDAELKFGYSVTGVISPARVLRNAGARVGDALYLSKPLGTGVITSALKRGLADPRHVAEAVARMKTLNRDAAAAALAAGASAATDVTGFGLLGHAFEMATASRVTLQIEAGAVPLLPGAWAYAESGQSQGMENNRNFLLGSVAWDAAVPLPLQNLLLDPQTSGGLLVAAAPSLPMPGLGACIGRVAAAHDGEPAIRVVA